MDILDPIAQCGARCGAQADVDEGSFYVRCTDNACACMSVAADSSCSTSSIADYDFSARTTADIFSYTSFNGWWDPEVDDPADFTVTALAPGYCASYTFPAGGVDYSLQLGESDSGWHPDKLVECGMLCRAAS